MEVRIDFGVACELMLHEDSAPVGEGDYVDLKANPERVGELLEAQQWPEFGEFIAAINRLPPFCTAGSKAQGGTPGGFDHPFVDIALSDEKLAESEMLLEVLQHFFSGLQYIPFDDNFVLEVWGSKNTFPDGNEVMSARIWFRGSREQAERTFPYILGLLAGQQTEMYQAIFEDEKAT